MKNQYRFRRLAAACILVLSPTLAGCTPDEIEGSMDLIATSFEQGGVERGLIDAIFVVNLAIPVAEMRFRAAFGP